MLTEENITMNILDYLEKNGWIILCFDYPQSGTGIYFKDESSSSEKNKNSINPDIIATKNNISLYFENKSYYSQHDIDLIRRLKKANNYRRSIDKKLKKTKDTIFYYGVGLPFTIKIEKKIKSLLKLQQIDFAILVNDEKKIKCYSRSTKSKTTPHM